MLATKRSTTSLIREYFFEGVPVKEVLPEIKALTSEEKQQLASGIANEMNISAEDCSFEFVSY